MAETVTAIERELLRSLPSIDEVLNREVAKRIATAAGHRRAVEIARTACDVVRDRIAASDPSLSSEVLVEVEIVVKELWGRELRSGIIGVVNATGVVIHTNLGRAPLSETAKRAIVERASHYCTLEYNLETGDRGKRGFRAERLVCELTGAEDAVIVNNGAAAAFLVLRVFAAGKEVVISRGELVEIGGDFRVPDVLTESGADLLEVGTTNRTKLKDYEMAISERTGLILRVHPSNYRITGFTERPQVADLAALAHRNSIPLFEDAGSGALVDLAEFGLSEEPLIADSIAAGADIVSFSGDKLLGGVQAGFIVGRKDLIESIRKHPLYRAFRVDKLAYAAIEATLESFVRGTHLTEIPVLQMLSMSQEMLNKRAESLKERIFSKAGDSIMMEIIEGESVIGGGSAPDVKPKTWLLCIVKAGMKPDAIEKSLRDFEIPVIARILDGRVVIDLRTVFEDEEETLIDAIASLAN